MNAPLSSVIDEHYVSSLRIHSGSYSRLQDFEACPYRAWLKYSAKIPEPSPPPGKETPLDRGTRIHNDAELYVKGEKPITEELMSFEEELHSLHVIYRTAPDKIFLEEMWCYDSDYNPVEWNDWDNIWLRIKQDAVILKEDTVITVDYKSGKKKGSEIKHNDQLRLASVGAYFRFPETYETFTLENWYVDQDDLVSVTMTREEIAGLVEGYTKRLLAMTNAVQFEPRPSTVTCRWCPYKTGKINKDQTGTGHCNLNPS